jgi:hypothetical protein
MFFYADHADTVQTTGSVTAFTESFNTYYQPAAGSDGTPGSMNAHIARVNVNVTLNNPIVSYNVGIGIGITGHLGPSGGRTYSAVNNMFQFRTDPGGKIDSMQVVNNYLDISGEGGRVFNIDSGVTKMTVSGNINMETGREITINS